MPRSLDRGRAEGWGPPCGLRHKQTPLSFELDGERPGLDFDDAVAPAHLERGARFKRRFPTDLRRNDEAAGRIDGSHHGIKSTTFQAMQSMIRCVDNDHTTFNAELAEHAEFAERIP